MKHIVTILFIGFLCFYNTALVQAQAGFFGSPFGGLIALDQNITGNLNYRNTQGSFTGQTTSLFLKGGFIHTFKNGAGNICGGTMYYRVYRSGSSAPAYSNYNLLFSANHSFSTSSVGGTINSGNAGDQRWGDSNSNIDLVGTLAGGNYNLEFYFEATGSVSGGCGSTFSYGTSGAPFTITFAVPYRTAQAGNWSSTSTWIGGIIPTSGSTVIINHNTSLDQSATVASLTNNNTLSINTGNILTTTGQITNIGTFNVSGTLQINDGGFVSNNAPVYTSTSTLAYNRTNGSNYNITGTTVEWTGGGGGTPVVGAGVPQNLTLTNATGSGNFNLNLPTTPQYGIAGNLTIGSNSTFVINAANDFYLAGNFTNNGSYTDNSSTLFIIGGASEQTIGGTTNTAFSEIVVNKTTGTTKLLNNITINTYFDLDNVTNTSDVDLNGFNIVLGSSASIFENNGTTNIFKDNTATTDIGTKGGYIEFTRTITSTVTNLASSGLRLGHSSGTDYSVTVRRYHYIPSGSTHPASPLNRGAKKVFQITGTPSGQTTIRLDYTSEELGILTSVDMLYKWNSGIGWRKATDATVTSPAGGMSITTGSGFVQAVGSLSSFSTWALGGNANPLPISLVSFEAEKVGEQEALLTWKTASELNNKGFYVEKSLDGQTVETLAFMEGKGNSQDLKTYQFTDKAFTTSAYYRLRQIDFDGTATVHAWVWVENLHIRVYPNPTSTVLSVDLGELTTKIAATLVDTKGMVVWKGDWEKAQNTIDVRSLIQGTYFLHFMHNGKKVVRKVVLK